MANVKVRYIGKKHIKRDTVTGSLAVWPGNNSVAEVPESVATKLCMYPDVWVPDDGEPLLRPVINRAPLPDPAEEDGANDDQDGTTDETAAETQADPTAEQPVVVHPEDQFGFEEPPPPAGPATVDEIVHILPLLDKEADFTDAGRPKVDSVRARFADREVTVKVLKEAWTKFIAAE
tara:strand:+ start:38230 stop:38760 length:531 start_codon:yes stop_codon:yes gene_type:complete